MVDMNEQASPLKERLELLPEWSSPEGWVKSLKISEQPSRPNVPDHEKAFRRFSICEKKALLALSCYYAEDAEAAEKRGKEFLEETKDYFFGIWRKTYQTAEKTVDPGWWKREFFWISIFEPTLLWGAALGEWDYLKRVGTFPEPDCCPDLDRLPQERDLFVAIGGFISDAPTDELSHKLDNAKTGKSKLCNLVVEIVQACTARNPDALNKAMLAYLKYYKKTIFPKQSMSDKVSLFGTFFVHWAKKESLAVVVPPEFLDHIVRMD